jgi:hypothetical protein
VGTGSALSGHWERAERAINVRCPKRDKNIVYFGFPFSRKKHFQNRTKHTPYFILFLPVSKHGLFFVLMFDGETCDRFLCQKDDQK